MPELPDIEAYVAAIDARLRGAPLERALVKSPFLLRTVEPSLFEAEGRRLADVRRLGKRIAIGMEGELFLVFHLRVAGRFHWRATPARPRRKVDLAAFRFPAGTLLLTEAAPKKRASLHVVQGEHALTAYDPGGLELLHTDAEQFAERLRWRNHTLKRALTDPTLFSGVGNAYSDEILHAAGLSPLRWTRRLTEVETHRLFHAARATLRHWVGRVRVEAGEGFPERVTAFRSGMAVHGRYRHPCPACGAPIQRICYADSEANYCPRCQTGGKILADRSLSRLMKGDWPRSLAALEEDAAGD